MRSFLGSLAKAAPVIAVVALVWQALLQPTPARLGLSSASAAPSPGVELDDTTTTVWDGGAAQAKRLWQITAHRINVSSDQRLTSFVGVTDGTLFRDGRPYAYLAAGSALFDQFANTLQVGGSVQLRLAEEGARLTTQHLSWQGRTRTVEIPTPVVLTGPEYRLDAARARVDLRRATVRVENVTGRWRGVRLTADTCDYHVHSQTLELQPLRLRTETSSCAATRALIDPQAGSLSAEHVHMVSSSPILNLTGHSGANGVRLVSAGLLAGLLATSATAAPAPSASKAETAKPKVVEFDGGRVEIRHTADGGEVTVLSDGAIFTHRDPKDPAKKLVLPALRVVVRQSKNNTTVAVATGAPKVTDDRSVVVGEKITLYTSRRQAVVEGHVRIATQVRRKPPSGATGPARAASSESDAPSDAARPRSLRDRIEGTVVITASRAEYNYRTKGAAADGDVVVTNKGWKLKMPRVLYDDRREMLLLTGPISGANEKGESVNHEGDLQVSVRQGDEWFASVAKGHVSGRLLIREDEEEEAASGTSSSSGGSSPAATKRSQGSGAPP